ncbi:MAG: SpoIIE family protein phosphatase [Acidimicrobiia bacterium]|nr:SpoIIE family protein phosphatase [Acidimicrobiia bacterium]
MIFRREQPDSASDKPMPAPVGGNLARVWVTVAFAILTIAGVVVVTVAGIRSAQRAESRAERAEIAAHVTIALRRGLLALQDERLMAELWLTDPSPDARDRYRDSQSRTEAALADVFAVWGANRALLDDAGPPTLNDMRSSLAPLTELRDANLRLTGGSSIAAYTGVADVVGTAARRLELVASDTELAAPVRAMVRLMESGEALAQQRDRVLELLASGREVTQDELIPLLLLEQAARTSLGSIRSLDGADLGAGITEFLVAMRIDDAQAILGELGSEAEMVSPIAWEQAATDRVSALRTLGDGLQGRLESSADGLRTSATRTVLLRSIGLSALSLVAVLAGVAAIGLARERASALEEHGELAAGLLEWFRADQLTDLDGVLVAARYDAASEYTRAGGDWYDTYVTPDGRVAVTIGDVAGHGASATAHMAQVRNLLRGITLVSGGSPAEQIRTLDVALAGADVMATVFHGLIDTQRAELTYVRAGHPPGLLRTAQSVRLLDEALGSPVGLVSGSRYTDAVVPLLPGNQIVLFTDGLVEARGEDVGDAVASIASWLADADRDVQRVADSLIGGRPSRSDDGALLVLAWDPEGRLGPES